MKVSRARPAAAPEHATIADTAYHRIRQDILTGILEPGKKLRMEFMCSCYAAGNTPIREALSRLSSEGLVDRQDHRGFSVARIGIEEMRDLTRTRCAIEALALRASVACASPDWEEGVILAYHRMSRVSRSSGKAEYQENPEWERLHRAFHESLIAACGSRWLLRIAGELADQTYRHRQAAVQATDPKRNEKREHEAIMRATLDGDADRAVQLLTAHYERTARIVISYIAKSTGAK